ncbi:nucleoside diphosphate kinase [Phytophthora pseudosyringae]|uniref:Nucleoside diphosphate kinase n=1 Tax=Phytophthora pseudosyringae TaxID=221518 RepID=A0A8T1VK10_9STRA|nr:nucleoside diphosphate kinase [Phytophthora pseudosyringae]
MAGPAARTPSVENPSQRREEREEDSNSARTSWALSIAARRLRRMVREPHRSGVAPPLAATAQANAVLLCGAAYAWKTGERCRTLSRGEARVLMPMYDYEPSLSLDNEGRASSTDDGSMGFFPDTPSSSPAFEDTSVVVVSADGAVEIHAGLEEEKAPPLTEGEEEEEEELSPEARALLPAPNSCPRSGINLRRQSPTFGSSKSHALAPRRAQSFGEGVASTVVSCTFFAPPTQPRLEDYLCTCKYCPRAVTIQRAFQLYGFALDHPQSDALLRVLRACANYDETVVEVDPLLVLHAEKMLEELGFDEDQAFRLLIASHFQRA